MYSNRSRHSNVTQEDSRRAAAPVVCRHTGPAGLPPTKALLLHCYSVRGLEWEGRNLCSHVDLFARNTHNAYNIDTCLFS